MIVSGKFKYQKLVRNFTASLTTELNKELNILGIASQDTFKNLIKTFFPPSLGN